jgi:hypothetical protein
VGFFEVRVLITFGTFLVHDSQPRAFSSQIQNDRPIMRKKMQRRRTILNVLIKPNIRLEVF